MTADSAGASPKPKQGRISGYFSTSKRTPLKTTAKKVVHEAVDQIKPVDLKESFKTIKSDHFKADIQQKELKPSPKKDKIVEAVVARLNPEQRDTLLGKRLSKSQDELAAPLEVAAWEKFDDLVTPVTKLYLPEKFTLLQRIHSALDSICQLSADRDQPAIFHRIKKAAENIVGREITLDHLKQLVGLQPDLYQLRPTPIIHQGRRLKSYALSFKSKLSQVELVERREALQKALLDFVTSNHKNFLDEIGVKIPDGAKLRSWHPKFNVESVPDLPLGKLEDNEEDESKKSSVPSQIKEALADLISNDGSTTTSETSTEVAKPQGKLSLLERIKMKEKTSEVAQMLNANGVAEKSKTVESEQLQDFADNLAFLFGTAGKGALPLGDVTNKLSLGAKSALSVDEIMLRIKRLVEVVPKWLQIVAAGNVQILRLDRAVSIKSVKQSISDVYQK